MLLYCEQGSTSMTGHHSMNEITMQQFVCIYLCMYWECECNVFQYGRLYIAVAWHNSENIIYKIN